MKPNPALTREPSFTWTRILNGDGVDVTAFMDTIRWSVTPIEVVTLDHGRELGPARRFIKAAAPGQGNLTVSAVVIRPKDSRKRSAPAELLVLVE